MFIYKWMPVNETSVITVLNGVCKEINLKKRVFNSSRSEFCTSAKVPLIPKLKIELLLVGFLLD